MLGDRCGGKHPVWAGDRRPRAVSEPPRHPALSPVRYGPEFIAACVRQWLAALGVRTLYIEPGSPWENGYCESFNSKLRDEFLNGEIFYSLKEAQILTERWRVHYNTVRPHSSLGYRPPAPMAYSPAIPQPSALRSPVSPVM